MVFQSVAMVLCVVNKQWHTSAALSAIDVTHSAVYSAKQSCNGDVDETADQLVIVFAGALIPCKAHSTPSGWCKSAHLCHASLSSWKARSIDCCVCDKLTNSCVDGLWTYQALYRIWCKQASNKFTRSSGLDMSALAWALYKQLLGVKLWSVMQR